MFISWVQKIKSPWMVMLLSIAISEFIYITVALLFLDGIPPIGLVLSFIIPSVASYPISSIMLKYHSKILDQKNELEHLNSINQKLFSTISHDIRSPISSASMLIDLTLSGTISIEENREQLKEVSSNINVLLAFLDDLLRWSKHQIEKKPLEPETFCTETILLHTIQLYKNVIVEKEIKLNIDNLKSLIHVDKGSYSFAVRNTLQNAVKYTPKGGLIMINVQEKDSNIITSIKDSGVGIPQEKIDNILYKRGYKSSKGTNQELGTGFGLRTAIEYLEPQGGKLEIDSEVNSGTEISIILPKKAVLSFLQNTHL